jgi:hypothetical protein
MTDDNNQILGEIIRVNSINTYVVKIPSEPLVEAGIGEFVGVESEEGLIVGVIAGVQRVIPEEVVTLLSVERESKYLPYNTDFKNNYYTAFGLGVITRDGVSYQLRVAPQIRSPVKHLNSDVIRQFHMKDGKPSISYFQRYRSMLGDELLLRMIEELLDVLPESSRMLHVIKKHLEESSGL